MIVHHDGLLPQVMVNNTCGMKISKQIANLAEDFPQLIVCNDSPPPIE
jgi:hypothetical protein